MRIKMMSGFVFLAIGLSAIVGCEGSIEGGVITDGIEDNLGGIVGNGMNAMYVNRRYCFSLDALGAHVFEYTSEHIVIRSDVEQLEVDVIDTAGADPESYFADLTNIYRRAPGFSKETFEDTVQAFRFSEITHGGARAAFRESTSRTHYIFTVLETIVRVKETVFDPDNYVGQGILESFDGYAEDCIP